MAEETTRIIDVYRRILAIIFERLSPTFGQRTIAAIAKNVLARQSRKHPVLKYLKVSERGAEWGELLAHVDEVPEARVSAGLEDFLDEFFEALSNLIGQLIVGKLFKEAEEMAKQGSEEEE